MNIYKSTDIQDQTQCDIDYLSVNHCSLSLVSGNHLIKQTEYVTYSNLEFEIAECLLFELQYPEIMG